MANKTFRRVAKDGTVTPGRLIDNGDGTWDEEVVAKIDTEVNVDVDISDLAKEVTLGQVKSNTDKLDILLSVFRDAITGSAGDAKTLANVVTALGAIVLQAGEYHTGQVGGHTGLATSEMTTVNPQAAYIAGDIILQAAGGLTEITNCTRLVGGSGYIVGMRLSTNKKSLTTRFRVHLFNANNPTLAIDNAPYKEVYADFAKRTWYYDLSALTTAIDTTNSDMSRVQDSSMRIPIVCAAGTNSLWWCLEALDGFTPDNGQKFTLKLNIESN